MASRGPGLSSSGLVAHVKHTQLAADSAKGVYYYPIYQRLDRKSSRTAFFIARGRGNAASLSDAIRKAVASIDPRQAVFDIKTMDQRIALALGPQQFAVSLLTAFAGAALLLAALGLYGVISYNVTQRTRELGIRAALGASRPQILGMVIKQGMRLVALGAVVGLCGCRLAGPIAFRAIVSGQRVRSGNVHLDRSSVRSSGIARRLHPRVSRHACRSDDGVTT